MQYDEIQDETGTRRRTYAAIHARSGVDVTRPDAAAAASLRAARIHPVPLVLDEDEVRSKLFPGVLQRALMLQALFEDIAIGSARAVKSGLLRSDELECILESGGMGATPLRQLWKGQSREQIRFVYGPDLARNSEGEWVVLEDNVGCLGGVAEGHATRETYLQATGLAAGAGRTARSDLARAIDSFLLRIGVEENNTSGLFGIAGWTSKSGCDPNDFETRCKADCLRSFGMTVTQPEELLGLIREGASDPAAIVNLSATMAGSYLDLARFVFATGQVPVFGAPGVELVASKSFLPFDQALAEEYLGEGLVLRSASSRLIRERPDRLPTDGVLKRSGGCQGTEVFFLDEARDEGESRKLLDSLGRWGPCSAILQEHVARSVLAGNRSGSPDAVLLEIRPIVYVYGWQTAFVGEAVAGRAIAVNTERRGNVSRGACFLPVLRENASSESLPARDRAAAER